MFPCDPFSDIQALKHEFPNLYLPAIVNGLHLYFVFRTSVPSVADVPSVAEWIVPSVAESSGYKRRNTTLVPVVRARFKPRCGRPHFAPTCNGVRVCGRNRTEVREREWAEGTVSSLPGTLNFRLKLCHSTGIARSGGGVRASTTSYA